jgi:hypothetical protein
LSLLTCLFGRKAKPAAPPSPHDLPALARARAGDRGRRACRREPRRRGYDLQCDEGEADFHLLSLDFRGAELMALLGCPELLARVSAVGCELGFEELYEGCALASDIDAHLAGFGFARVATTTPRHSSWGDGF